MKRIVIGGVAVLLLAAAAPSMTLAAPLTRSSCWTASFEGGSERQMCFFAPRRVTMKNSNRTTDGKGWSTCEFTGDYIQRGDAVTVTFAPNSGRCSNGASSPQFTAVCEFNGEEMPCRGSSIINGRTYEFSGTFN